MGGANVSKPRLPVHSSSQSSLEHSEDMVELDFSHNSRNKSRGRHSNEKLSVPPSSSLSSASSYSTAEGSYLESPRLGSQPDLAPSPPRASLLARAFGRSPPKNSPPSSALHHFRNLGRVLETPPGYVEMRPSTKGDMQMTHASSPPNTSGILSPVSPTGSTTSTLTNLTSCSPPNKSQPFRIKTGTPPKFIDEDEDPYMDMAPNPQSTAYKVTAVSNPQPTAYKVTTHPRSELVTDYMEMNLKRKTSLEEDNNNKRCGLKSRPSSVEERAEDYMNMNVGKKDRRKTQPITISSSPAVNSPLSSSRKLSGGTPPKAPLFLPLSNSSPARTTRRKSLTKRDNSRESTTPTIFPFSLSSPALSPAESVESPSCNNTRLSEPLASVKEVVDSNMDSDYVNFAPDAVIQGKGAVVSRSSIECDTRTSLLKDSRSKPPERGDEYVEMQPTPSSLSDIAPPALASVAQGKTLEQVQKKLVILGLSKKQKNSSPPPNK